MGGKAMLSEDLEETSECEGCSSPRPRAVTPYLVKQHDSNAGCSLYNIFKKSNEEECENYIPELRGTKFYQKPSHQGWLIIHCDYKDYDYIYAPRWNYGDCFLWNPSTDEKIQLPSLKEFFNYDGGYEGYIYDCVLSSPPYKSTDRSTADTNSMVIFLYQNFYTEHDDYRFLFCRPGETQWRIHELSPDIVGFISERIPQTILCFKGELYAMCTDVDNLDNKLDHHLEIKQITKAISTIHFYKLDHQQVRSSSDVTLSIKPFTVKKDVLFPSSYKNNVKVHYVDSHDELFRVTIIKDSCRVISIQVVMLNFLSMEWLQVNSFENHVLFIGTDDTTGCCLAADLGLTSGCLYYLFGYRQSLHRFQIESTSNTITWPCPWSKERDYFSEWVIMPVNDQGREECMLGKYEENSFLTELEIKTCSRMVVNDCSAGEFEAASYWNNLNEDIVLVISNHLHGSDYKNLRLVCKAYRAIIPKVQATSYLSPWLVFSRDHNSTSFNVVNPMYSDENYSISLSKLADYTIRFQKGGWLLMTRNQNILFYNPFTRETVKLPDMDGDYYYSVVSFSSLPTSSDCIVVAMALWKDGIHINCIRKGEAHWRHWSVFIFFQIETSMPFLKTAVFHDGAFFCLDDHGTVGRFSTKDNNWNVVKEPVGEFFEGYLVECFGDLLLVQLERYRPPVKIFKLNFFEMEWVEVKSLGEHMLFIGDNSCASAVAPNSNMKNKIYFPRLHVNRGGIVFYSLETGSYHSVGSEHSIKGLLDDTQGWFRNCTWIQPNKLKSTSQELDWLKTPS